MGFLVLAGWATPAVVLAADDAARCADHEDLVEIHGALEALRSPRARHGLQDFEPATVKASLTKLERLRERLDRCPAKTWPLPERVDAVLVRSMLDQHEFMLRVARPWARDPGFFVDPLYALAFTELPARGEDRAELEAKLAGIPKALAEARGTLSDVARDYAQLALRNLTQADGVGHGHPFRTQPPPGVLGWYEDLKSRAEKVQPDLLPRIAKATEAIRAFEAWLRSKSFSAEAGVGAEVYDWYLRHVKLMPYTAAELEVLAEREIARLGALLALARHRNRALPALAPAKSAEDYQARIRAADRDVRTWIEEASILTVPDFVGALDTNVPWIVRPGGRNFWEEIQYRDPTPDHVHAVIPGHRFDWKVSEAQTHPIRRTYWDAGRVEGWAVYLEEMAQQTGLLDERPRTHELFYIFGLKRATRIVVDIGMQHNRMSVDDAVRFMTERVPFLDDAVARVDAEIYIRRPPGYGLSYTVGKLQIERLLARRARRLGDRFDLEAFHDELLSLGRIPVSLIAWQMTGGGAAQHLENPRRLREVLNPG